MVCGATFIKLDDKKYINPANIANIEQRFDGYVTVNYKERPTDREYKNAHFSIDKLRELQKQGLNLIG